MERGSDARSSRLARAPQGRDRTGRKQSAMKVRTAAGILMELDRRKAEERSSATMQRILIVAFVSAICVSTTYGQREQGVPERRVAAPGAHTEGRYQLFQGSYHVKGFDRVVREDAVSRITTQTGKIGV